MEFLVGIATSIVEKAAEYTVKPVCRQLGYLFYYKNNVDDLKMQIQELGYTRDRLQHRIEEARRNGEEIEADVENWLSNVEKIKEESNNFLQNEDHAKTRCSSNGPFPNLVSRHQLSRKANKMMQVVVGEICKAEKFEKISYRPPIPHAIANQGYEVFESRDQALKEIIEALKDINVRMIGMYGMGGIGKTVLAKEVARIAKEEKLFDEVAFTTVSQSPDVGSIQQEIAERLGLQKFYEIKSLNVRADRLRHRLSQEKNILVILDDVWNELNLSTVGIDFSNHQKGCKILLTSRSRNVLQDSMGVERNIEVKVLSETEAIDLFRKNVGCSSEDVHFQPLAKKIVKECGGLPIAITTVAHALRNKSLSIWEDALRQLERSMPVNIEGMDQKVYASIKLSYDFLEHDEEAKSLLLLSSLHEEDAYIEIESLMMYALGWGLFREVYTIEEARNRVDSLIIKLKGRCLLLAGYDGAVKMHDIIRDVMLSIASQDKNAFQNLVILSLFKLKNLERIYCGELSRESFGKLKFLNIGSCDKLKNLFSSSIARQFKGIHVIGCKMMKEIVSHGTEDDTHNAVDTIEFPHLCSLTLEDLPEFVQFIRTEMETTDTSSSDSPMPLFSKKVAFPCLESLQISGMKFKDLCSYQLPTTSHFRNLKTITVYKCNNLKHLLPFAVAKNLVHLTRLEIKGCMMMEEVLFTEKEGLLENISFPKMTQLSLVNLPKLEKFCVGDTIEFPMVLRLDVIDCPRLKTFIKSSEIKSIAEQLFFSEKVMFPELGELWMDGREVIHRTWHPQFSTVPVCMLGNLRLTYNDEKSIFFPFGFIQRFQNLNFLFFEGSSVEEICQHQEIDASQEPDGPPLRVRSLSLRCLPNLRHLFENPENFKSGKAFQNIEALFVYSCGRLKRLVPFLDYFRNLKDLQVSSCDGMKSLFASSTAKSLVQLTRMSIGYCQQMREIVACKEDGTEDEIVFDRLRILALYELPSLESFYSGNGAMRFPILDKVILIQCPQMEVFSHGIVTTQKLNQIITNVVNEDMLWPLDGIEYELYPRQQLWNGDINSTVRKIWEDDPIITPQDLFNED